MLGTATHTLSLTHTVTHTHSVVHTLAVLTAAVTPRNEDRQELKRRRGWSGALNECTLQSPPD